MNVTYWLHSNLVSVFANQSILPSSIQNILIYVDENIPNYRYYSIYYIMTKLEKINQKYCF